MNYQNSTPATAELAQRFSSTPRGARLARHLSARQLDVWGFPYGGEVSDTAQLVVAELAANAVTHGRVPGRDFELRLLLRPEGAGTLRIEVSDARGDARLRFVTAADEERGRGLVLVSLLAVTWGVEERAVGKTVWAEVALGPAESRDDDGSARPCPRTPAQAG